MFFRSKSSCHFHDRSRSCSSDAAKAAVWRASFPPLPLTSAPEVKVCVPSTSAPPTSTGFSQRGAATDASPPSAPTVDSSERGQSRFEVTAPDELKPFPELVSPTVDAAVSAGAAPKKCTAGFDAFFAEWQRKHPDWVRHQDSIAAIQMKSEPVPIVSQPLLPAKPASPATAPKGRLRGCKSVVCKNLSTIVEEDEIWEFFDPCMSMRCVKLVTDPMTGASKGIAYVNFSDEVDVDEALKLHGTKLMGTPMRIECFFGKWPR